MYSEIYSLSIEPTEVIEDELANFILICNRKFVR